MALLSWDRAVSGPDLCCPVGTVYVVEGKAGERVESSLLWVSAGLWLLRESNCCFWEGSVAGWGVALAAAFCPFV